jgi:hypothetical protein
MNCRVSRGHAESHPVVDCRSAVEWLFAWQCYMCSDAARAETEGFRPDPPVAAALEKAGMRLTGQGLRAGLERENPPAGSITCDFAGMPVAAIPFAVACAALGIQADLRGLGPLMHYEGADLVSPLQRALYRLNVLTDFCDRSKLKVLSERPMRKCSGPLDVRAHGLLALFFVPLVIRLGEMEFNASEVFLRSYEGLLKRSGFEAG